MNAKVKCEVRFTNDLVQITTDRGAVFQFKCTQCDNTTCGTISGIISAVIGGTINNILFSHFGESLDFSFEFQTNTGAETR